jgi:hypothetical protein
VEEARHEQAQQHERPCLHDRRVSTTMPVATSWGLIGDRLGRPVGCGDPSGDALIPEIRLKAVFGGEHPLKS